MSYSLILNLSFSSLSCIRIWHEKSSQQVMTKRSVRRIIFLNQTNVYCSSSAIINNNCLQQKLYTTSKMNVQKRWDKKLTQKNTVNYRNAPLPDWRCANVQGNLLYSCFFFKKRTKIRIPSFKSGRKIRDMITQEVCGTDAVSPIHSILGVGGQKASLKKKQLIHHLRKWPTLRLNLQASKLEKQLLSPQTW